MYIILTDDCGDICDDCGWLLGVEYCDCDVGICCIWKAGKGKF